MIQFSCTKCDTSYAVEDARAGMRTRCARCKNPLVVPGRPTPPAEPAPEPAVRPRPPAKVVATLAGLALCTFLLIGLVAYLATPAPTRQSVERQLREDLPPGYESLRVDSFDPDTGRLQFVVTYLEPRSMLETQYTVIRYKVTAGWRVQVTGQRPRWDNPVRKPVMIEAAFDRRGRVAERGVDAAPAGEAAVFERRAREIARAVHGAY